MSNINQLLLEAENGDKQAQAQVSLAYFKGEGLPFDLTLGLEWFKKAAEDRELVDALFTIEEMVEHPRASFVLSRVWGRCLRPRDIKDFYKADLFLISSAENGYVSAEHDLGVNCEVSSRIPAEYRGHKQAAYWYNKSLEHGYPHAHRSLYLLYSGERIAEALDYDKAFYHVSQIVEKGDGETTAYIGSLYVQGQGTEKDVEKGAMWLYLAACRDPEGEAAETLKSVKATMSDEEYARAESAALDWIRNNAETAVDFNTSGGLADPIKGVALDITGLDSASEDTQSKSESGGVLSQEKLDLITKWHQYYANESSVNYSELYQLLTEDPILQDEHLNDIFQYYDCKKELIKRYKIVCDCRFGRSKIDAVVADIEAAAKKDLLFKYKLCKASDSFDDYEDVLGDISEKHIKKAKVKFVNTTEFDEQRHNMFYEIMNEVVGDHLSAKNITGLSGLREALYGVTADYDLVNYVLGAFTDLKLNFKPYIAVRNAGAEYDLTPDELLIKLDRRRKVVE